ncbi:MAG: DUF5050 domain-containing protein [Lachnospiraceae bacterium]|nr:DUF5050 domain-containing protein [Lachnospiraceae bacterium]
MNSNVKLALVFLGMALILIGAFFIVRQKNMIPENPEDTVGNTASNLYNGGLFCQSQDGTVYFSNAYDDGALYSMTVEEMDVTQVNKYNSKWINSAGKFIYYYQSATGKAAIAGFSGQVMGIYRQKKGDSKAFCLDRTISGALSLSGSDLLYQHYTNVGGEGMSIFRTKIDKSESLMILDQIVDPSCVVKGKVYYAGIYGDHNLYRMEPKTGNTNVVFEGGVWNPVVMDDANTFYFMNVQDDYRIYKGFISTGESEKITDERVDCFNVTPTGIFYQANTTYYTGLMKCDLDGGNPIEVMEGNFTALNSTGSYLYFKKFGEEGFMYKTPIIGAPMVSEFSAAREAALKNKK